MLLTGTGLRRDEAAGLRWGQLQQREGRWVLVDILGKGSKLRTVPVPAFAWVALEEWRTYGVFRDGSEQDLRTDKSDSIFHPVTRYGHVEAASLSPQAIYKLVRGYGEALGVKKLAPHDLRRSFSRLADKNKASMEQLRITLGHSTIVTTQRYLGSDQNFAEAPCDVLGLDVEE
jgi:integrase